MTNVTANLFRIIPRDSAFLDRKLGSRGEIFFDKNSNTLRLYDGSTNGGIPLAKSNLSNISNSDFRNKSVESSLSTVVYTVTIVAPQGDDVGNKYNLNGEYAPELNFVVGYTYVFDQSDLTNVYFPNANGTTVNPHPLNFSADNANGILGGGTVYIINVVYLLDNIEVTRTQYSSAMFNTATNRQVRITVTNSTPATLYYYCSNHQNMGHGITIADPGSGTGGNAFQSIRVSGQDNVVAEAVDDFVNFNEGSGIAITTNAATDTITFTNTGILDLTAGNGITISDQGSGTKQIANSGILSVVAGTGINTSVNAGTVTINSTVSTGNVVFTGRTVDSDDSTAITFTPSVVFDSDITVYELVFPDGSRQTTATLVGPTGPEGPPGATGSGSGDVSSVLGGYTDNAIVLYSGTSGTTIKTSSASINGSGILTSTGFSGSGTNLTSLNATQLTSGTVPDARFPATLPAASGTNLTNLNATNLSSGTVPIDRLGTSGTRDATTFLRGDNTWTVVSGGSESDSFKTIAVSGQTSVVAESSTDTLTLVAGTGITITTDAGTDTITITNSGSTPNLFSTIAVTGQSNVVADSNSDTLNIAAGTGISITTDAGTDTVTISSTVTSGATSFTQLSDSAGLTIDQIYLPAITMLTVSNSGASAYLFDQYSGNNPTIYAINGTTIAFKLNASGHPFLIQTGAGVNYNTGLVHVSTTGTVSTGASAQGKDSGTLYWKIPAGISGGYRYQCQAHGPMVGSITIKDFVSI